MPGKTARSLVFARLLVFACLAGWTLPLHAQALDARLVVAQGGAHQPPHTETPAEKQMTAEERMNRRFPQPAKVGDLIGLALLDDYDLTIGYVRHVVRTPQGKIRLIVTQGGWLGPWFDYGTRLVAVPIEVVAILGRQIDSLDMPRQEFATAPTWSEKEDQIIPPTEMIRIAVSRR
jgi:hypothetical protein